jgi:hypothetical protein
MRLLQPTELFITMEYSKSLDNLIRTLLTKISVSTSNHLTRFILNCSRGLIKAVKVALL